MERIASPPSYRPDIDGLRAVAVLAVVFFHAFPQALPGGFAGVDVFFVISGYLIGGIILSGLDAGRFSFRDFYHRRIRRLLPALVLVLLVTTALAALLLPPSEFSTYTFTLRAAILSVSNIIFALRTGYFDQAAHQAPLLHTWSLSVEEQFYLLFPLLIWLVHRSKRDAVGPVILAVGIASFAAGWWGSLNTPGMAFFLPVTRFWQLMLGVGLFWFRPGERLAASSRAGMAGAGLLLVIYAFVAHSGARTPYPGPHALIPSLGAAMLIEAGRYGAVTVSTALAGRLPVAIGLISYPLYLWHWPLLVFARAFGPAGEGLAVTLAVLASSLVLSVLTYLWIERPLRHHPGFSARRAFAALGGAVAVFVGISLVSEATRGLSQRFSPETRQVFRAIDEWQASPRLACMRLGEEQTPTLREATGHPCRIGAEQSVDVILWGDSHGAALQPALDQALKALGRGGIAITGSCRPAQLDPDPTFENRDCLLAMPQVLRQIIEHPARIVILAQRWSAMTEGLLPAERRARTFAPAESEERAARLDAQLRQRIDQLRAAGKTVLLIGTVPESPFHVPNAVGFRLNLGMAPVPPLAREAVLSRQARTRALFDRLAGQGQVAWFDPVEPLCQPGCPLTANGRVLYFDNNHLTIDAAPLLAPALESWLTRVAPR